MEKTQKISSSFADEVFTQGMGYMESMLRTFDPLEQAVFRVLMGSRAALSTKAVHRNLALDFVRYLGNGGKGPYLASFYDFLPTNPKWHEKFRNLVRREAIKEGFRDVFEEMPIGVVDQDEMRFYAKICRVHGFVLPGFRRVKTCLENLETLGFTVRRKIDEKRDVYSVHPRIIAASERQKEKVFNKADKVDSHGKGEEKKGQEKGQVLGR